MTMIALVAAVALTGCHAVDGDTIRCRSERIRLLGIDAPELPGHCRRGRLCAPGDPLAAKRDLSAFLRGGPVSMEPVTRDRYGRTVGIVRVRGVNASCHMLRHGAIYKRAWDNGLRVGRECRR